MLKFVNIVQLKPFVGQNETIPYMAQYKNHKLWSLFLIYQQITNNSSQKKVLLSYISVVNKIKLGFYKCCCYQDWLGVEVLTLPDK